MTDDERERLAEGYRAFGAESAPESPRYSALAAAVAGDRDVLDFLLGLPPGKRHPTLLLAALRFLGGVPADGAELRDRVASDAVRLRDTVLTRATQTNEPARCAALLPALAAIDGPLALVEVGASAGLCLYPDRYGYEYDGRPVGPPGPVRLRCTTGGAVPVPVTPPEVVARIGVDLQPLDVTDPDDLAWLRALVWPGPVEAERLQRLDAAAAIAAREPPTLLAGDLLDRLPDALALVPDGATPVVLHTAVLPYVEETRRAAFVDRVRSLPVRWVAQEGAGMVPGTGEPHPGGWGPHFVLSLDGVPLAHTAPHGGRVDWLG
ncbi:DUF2332 domain-containing protein [Geodermatophilus dictyosporus]|uniref:DUF2332 domain-containing protein n=1 Tax=Geodermatophilus dictyosporus TaxID=1523247 RepID=UPI000B884447|nr:DUF2332 domain-containing protein [Geodermatophilus dictyosporus]